MGILARAVLARHLLLGEFVVLVTGMLVAGAWLSRADEQRLIDHEGERLALLVASALSGHVQSIADDGWLDDAGIVAVDRVFHGSDFAKGVIAFKLCSRDGRVLYSNDLTAIGTRLAPAPAVAAALQGETRSHVVRPGDAGPAGANAPTVIETSAPMRDPRTSSIVAVSQIAQTGEVLLEAIAAAQRRTWAVVIAVTAVMYLLLAALVRHANRFVLAQEQESQKKLSEVTVKLAQNEERYERMARAAEGATAHGERFLHRVAVDLHDGPCQELVLAMMHLGQLAEVCGACSTASGAAGETVSGQIGKVQRGLSSALDDMRSISRGLHVPQIEQLSLADIASRAVRHYEQTSGVSVDLTVNNLPEDAPLPVKITVFRLLQEALANGFRHGGAVNQCVILDSSDHRLQVEARDGGRGFTPQAADGEDHLGLAGMRERVEMLGGTFVIWSAVGKGTVVRADLPLSGALLAHD